MNNLTYIKPRSDVTAFGERFYWWEVWSRGERIAVSKDLERLELIALKSEFSWETDTIKSPNTESIV